MNDDPTKTGMGQAEINQKRLTAGGAELLSTSEVLGYGLGGFYSIYGLFFLFLCSLAPIYAYNELVFALKTNPIEVTVNDIENLIVNDYVKLTCEMDYVHGLDIKTVGGKQYSLIPVAGTGNRLIIFQSGVTTEKEMANSKGPSLDVLWARAGQTNTMSRQIASSFRSSSPVRT